MQIADEKIIELSKKKIVLMIAGSCLFVALGLWMAQLDASEIEQQRRFNNPIVVHGFGILAAAFFGLCGLFGVTKLFDGKPGLVLNSAGMLHNVNGASPGLIPWPDIAGFDIFEVHGTKLLIVLVTDLEKYVETGSSARRALNRLNTKMCGSPISIASSALKTDFNTLLEDCNTYFNKYGR